MQSTMRSALATLALFVLLLCGSAKVFSQTDNSQANSQVEIGQKLYREAKYADAITSLKKAVKANPNDVDAWTYLGLSFLKVNDFKNATKAFESACKLQPNSA